MKAVCRRLFIILALCASVCPVLMSATGFNLAIKTSGKSVVVSWPTAATNYVLQSSLSLSSANWLAVTNPVVTLLTTNSVTYTNNAQTRFFRLFLNTNTGFLLSINRAGGNTLVVSWPTAATNYVLQTTVSLAPANWQTITNPPPTVVNNTNFLTYTNNSQTRFFRLFLNTNTASGLAGMVQIPGGAFTMGDITDTNINGDAASISVTVSTFYMDTNLVNYSLWQSVYNTAVSAGYNFVHTGAGQGANHPVQTVNWYDVVKWCNARSQQAGLTPVYYTDAGLTLPYTNGETDAVFANWSATGYRLPTEAEWEKAARGGLAGKRFPWGDVISRSLANYLGGGYFYDAGPSGNNPIFAGNGQPYTSPVGFFAPNGYGLYDMAGNLAEWCWDWYGTPYAGGTDPHGPSSGPNRVLRGGDWGDDASVAHCGDRNYYSSSSFYSPSSNGGGQFGFRCVRTH